jgi:hypothetical protein
MTRVSVLPRFFFFSVINIVNGIISLHPCFTLNVNYSLGQFHIAIKKIYSADSMNENLEFLSWDEMQCSCHSPYFFNTLHSFDNWITWRLLMVS